MKLWGQVNQPFGCVYNSRACANCRARAAAQPPRRFQPQPFRHAQPNQPMPPTTMQQGFVPQPLPVSNDQTVTFEPYDPSNPSGAPHTQTAAHLAEFAQDERNGAAFYAHLSGLAHNERARTLLDELRENSLARSQSALELARGQDDTVQEPVARAIDQSFHYTDGIAWAIEQEGHTISRLAELYEQEENDRCGRGIHSLLAKKMGDLGKLLLLR